MNCTTELHCPGIDDLLILTSFGTVTRIGALIGMYLSHNESSRGANERAPFDKPVRLMFLLDKGFHRVILDGLELPPLGC